MHFSDASLNPGMIVPRDEKDGIFPSEVGAFSGNLLLVREDNWGDFVITILL